MLTVLLILWLTLARDPVGDIDLPLFPGADKIAHGIMFGFLTFVLMVDYSHQHGWRKVRSWEAAVAALASTSFGIVIEIAQREMDNGRSFDILDIAADVVGSLTVAVIWIAFGRNRHRIRD